VHVILVTWPLQLILSDQRENSQNFCPMWQKRHYQIFWLMCNWVGGLGFGLDIGAHNFEFLDMDWIWSLCKNFGSNPIAKFPYPYTPLICTRHASCVICGLMRLSLWSHVLFWCVWYRLRSSRTCFYVDASDSLLFVRESPHDSAYLIGYSMLVEVFVASKSWCVRHILSFIGLL